LHYEIIKNGVRVNPMTVTFPRIDDLTATQKSKFLEFKGKVDQASSALSDNPNLFIPM